MTAAAFKGTYSDWRLIKGRKVVQVVIEIPLEAADEAYAVLGGMPNPASEIWCGVARLAAGAPAVTEPEMQTNLKESGPDEPAPAQAHKGRPPAQLAGILCTKPMFWKFAQERGHAEVKDKESAKLYVRAYCGVDTRADIKAGTQAEQRLNLMLSSFKVWEKAPSCGAAA